MMLYLLSVRAPEDEDLLLFDKINHRVAHLSRLNANTTTIQSEPMLVRIEKNLKVTMCVFKDSPFKSLIRIWNIVLVRKLWNRRRILASYRSFWTTDWWQNSNNDQCVRSAYSRYLPSSLHITIQVNYQLKGECNPRF